MKIINFRELLDGSGMSQADLARELTAHGFYRNFKSAITSMNNYNAGTMKTINSDLVNYLMKRFDKTLCELIKF